MGWNLFSSLDIRENPLFVLFSSINHGFGRPWDMLRKKFLTAIFIMLQKNAFGQKFFFFMHGFKSAILEKLKNCQHLNNRKPGQLDTKTYGRLEPWTPRYWQISIPLPPRTGPLPLKPKQTYKHLCLKLPMSFMDNLVHVLLFRFYLDFILILSKFYPDKIRIKSG